MHEGQKFLKLSTQEPRPAGGATIFPILSKFHGNPPFGFGISETVAGVVELELNYDEAIYVLDGEMDIVAGEERHSLSPGDFLWMPRGPKIKYVVERDRCRFIYVVSPASPNS